MSRLFQIALLASALMLASLSRPAMAQEFTAAQRGAAETRLAQFDGLLSGDRLGDGVDFLPPPLIQAIATRYGVSVDQARAAARSGIESALEGVTIERGGHDFSRAEIRVTPDGRRTYLLVPMSMVMSSGGLRAASTSQSLIFEDGGQWWIMSVEPGPLTDVLVEAYPEFRGVEFPFDGTFEILD